MEEFILVQILNIYVAQRLINHKIIPMENLHIIPGT